LLASSSFDRRKDLPLTRLRPLAAGVRAAGIRRVTGGIVADESVFDSVRTVPQAGISGGPFLGPLSGLDYDSGLVHGHLARNPAKVAGRALRDKLRADGVLVDGGVRVRRTPPKLRRRRPLATVHSPSVAELIAATNRPSNDFFAEMLLKRLAVHHGHGGTTRRGAALVERFASRLGSGVSTPNGSGLSRLSRASPSQVVALLAAMNNAPHARSYRSSLPLACGQGTVAQRMCSGAADGKCRTKTGTLADVSTLSGYCRAKNGHLLAFSILMNAVTNIDAAHLHQDRMAALIARYGG
jgi:D-alanyl-D-alanine carboxypeptidase/D-alanyl-D-alanine-endopeptidase (penicillin-binding protein 4)